MTSFGATEPFTIGVEEEFQILDPDDHSLVSHAGELLDQDLPGIEENLRSELFQSVIETASDVCGDVDDVRKEVWRLRRSVARALEDKGFGMAASSTHPFAHWRDQEPTDADRYEKLIDDIGWPARRDLIFGLHVHVSVRNPGEAIYVNDNIRPFLPLLLALSANSPFWEGEDTGLHATRSRIFDAMPRSGLPNRFGNWTTFQQDVHRLQAVGAIDDISDIWWDTRPRPELGTVEVRIADLPTDPQATVALAGLTQALVKRLADAHEAGEQPPVTHTDDIIEENRWRAIRDGVHAEFIQYDNVDGVERLGVDDVLEATVQHLDGAHQELGLKDEIAYLQDRAQRGHTGADRQLEVREEEGSLQAVAGDIAERSVP
jgi:carboxylate-amine ligase